MGPKLIKRDLIGIISKKLWVLIIPMIVISCKNVNDNEIIRFDYQDMITHYDLYYGFDLNKPKETMRNLNTFIASNYNDLGYGKKYTLQLKENDSTILINSSNIFNRNNITLKLNLNKERFDYCQNSSLAMTGYFSKNLRTLEGKYLREINEYLLKSFQDSIIIPAFSKEKIKEYGSKIVYKYRNESISVLCSTNFPDVKKINEIQDSLFSYIKRENLGFDYALIPVEKNNLK